jgi:uncharacterized protein (DUF2252 family)
VEQARLIVPVTAKTQLFGKRFAPLKDRRALGHQRRNLVGRSDQSVWRPPSDRRDPVAALIAINKRGRQQDLLPIKWGRMDESPFCFLRGSAPLMAADLAAMPRTGLRVQLCGDAHIMNLGAYAAPDGHLVFDLNDFDETIPGPWEWDVKRLATSLILAGRDAGDRQSDCLAAVRTFVASYRNALDRFSKMKVMELAAWEVRRQTQSGPVRAILQKAERATPAATLQKLTIPSSQHVPRFHDKWPLLRHVERKTAAAVLSSLTSYRATLGADHQQVLDAYRPVDVAFKIVGTGSIGTRNYLVVLVGHRPDDVLFLQVKEELSSCYAQYLQDVPPFPHQGRRVAEGQHRLQTYTDPFVGWTTIAGSDYLVRQLADHKAAVNLKELKQAALSEYALVCGEVLAKAHARTGDSAAIAGYCGSSIRLDKAIARFSLAYADQTEADHAALHKAIKQGTLKAAKGS